MLYKIALFLHIIGALMLCAAIAIEWLCIINLKKADTIAAIKASISNYSRLGIIGGLSMALILIPGIYMMVTVWQEAAWIIISFIALILIGVIGGAVSGRKMNKVKKVLKNEDSGSSKLRELLQGDALWVSIKLRTAIFIGVIFMMTIKTDLPGSILTLCISALAGFLPLQKAGRNNIQISG